MSHSASIQRKMARPYEVLAMREDWANREAALVAKQRRRTPIPHKDAVFLRELPLRREQATF